MNQNKKEYTKDPLLTFKGTKAVVTKKGANGFQYSMNQEQATLLYEELGKVLTNPNGVKIALYTQEKESQDGRAFLSSFGFVSAIQDRPGFTGTTQVKKVGTTSAVSPDVAAKIKALKGEA